MDKFTPIDPNDFVDLMNETPQEWLIRRIASLEKQVAKLQTAVQEESAMRVRCKNMIETLMVRLRTIDVKGSTEIITDAAHFLNCLEMMEPSKLPRDNVKFKFIKTMKGKKEQDAETKARRLNTQRIIKGKQTTRGHLSSVDRKPNQ